MLWIVFGVALIAVGQWFLWSNQRASDRPRAMLPIGAGLATSRDAQPAQIPAAQLSGHSTPLEGRALAAQPATDGSPARLVLHVRHAGGEPARGARVALRFDNNSAWFATGTLDDLGTFDAPGSDAPAKLVVVGATALPAHFELASASGAHELTLPEGAVIAGRVLIDGAPPGAPFPVALSLGLDEHLRLHAQGFPEAQSAGLVLPALAGSQLTDSAGAFHFSGVPLDEHVWVHVPRPFLRVAERSSEQPMRAPQHEVLLNIARPASLFGRVVHRDGTPAAQAALHVTMLSNRTQEPEPDSPEWGAFGMAGLHQAAVGHEIHATSVQHDGSFELPIGNLLGMIRTAEERREQPAGHHEVTVRASCPHGGVSRALEDVDIEHDTTLADFVIDDADRVTLRVVDVTGAAVGGAVVTLEAPGFGDSRHEVDEQGEVTVERSVEHFGPVTILALGFESVRVTPWGAAEQPVVVELPRAAGLEIALRGPWDDELDGDSGWLFRSSIVADDTPFQDALHPAFADGVTRVGPARGRPRPSGSQSIGSSADEQQRRVHHDTFTHGELLYDALRAHHPIHVEIELLACPENFELRDDVPAFAADAWLEPGERRVIDVDVTSQVHPR
ncbi:MAG: hypothetical protein DHS20C15_28460 [Planctomycetota bacterium]|nr:MAG: hypothetical protein DHS20C15_28460 [Planctomycetota bacterium]